MSHKVVGIGRPDDKMSNYYYFETFVPFVSPWGEGNWSHFLKHFA